VVLLHAEHSHTPQAHHGASTGVVRASVVCRQAVRTDTYPSSRFAGRFRSVATVHPAPYVHESKSYVCVLTRVQPPRHLSRMVCSMIFTTSSGASCVTYHREERTTHKLALYLHIHLHLHLHSHCCKFSFPNQTLSRCSATTTTTHTQKKMDTIQHASKGTKAHQHAKTTFKHTHTLTHSHLHHTTSLSNSRTLSVVPTQWPEFTVCSRICEQAESVCSASMPRCSAQRSLRAPLRK
jgi:hypothetical protein